MTSRLGSLGILGRKYCSRVLPTTTRSRHLIRTVSGVTGKSNGQSDSLRFPGAMGAKYTTKLKFDLPGDHGIMDCYRVMDTDGMVVDKSYKNDLTDEEVVKLYETMVGVSIMDVVCLDAQRQGRMSFYMVSSGEEGIAVGSASALDKGDVAFGQYREVGMFMQRGFTFDNIMSQLFANVNDTGRGRNMPVHYGSRELNIHSISSPLATQLPHAAGAAYALKLRHRASPKSPPQCVVAYFGEGAASEGDAHAAFNIASTRACPVIFLCRNNGYAISTPTEAQYRGDGIASRGAAYGMPTIRVDGNDILAVRRATQQARLLCLGLTSSSSANTPVLIEAMSYRVSHHSTSDDSFAYRKRTDVEDWARRDSPIVRLRKYLERSGKWDAEREREMRTRLRADVLAAFSKAEKEKKVGLRFMFEDVYEELTPGLREQKEDLRGILERYPGEYEVGEFEGGVEGLRG